MPASAPNTVVVSPRLALQLDQIKGLLEWGPELHAARVSSAETGAQRQEAPEASRSGEVEFLFMSPCPRSSSPTAT